MEKKQIKSIVASGFALFLSTANPDLLSLPGQAVPELRAAPVNPAFLKALEDIRNGRIYHGSESLGYFPSPVNLTYYTGFRIGTLSDSYPASYDLRAIGKVPPVRDQGSCGSFWSFGAFVSLESSLLAGEARDFAELHMIRNHGYDRTECAGGGEHPFFPGLSGEVGRTLR